MDISHFIEEKIKEAVKNTYNINMEFVEVEHPDNEEHGDFATNVALKLAGTLKQRPSEIAKKLVYELSSTNETFDVNGQKFKIFEKIDLALPGFINFKLSTEWLNNVLFEVNESANNYGSSNFGAGKTIIVEYSQPNTNKPMHIGHARNNFIGSSLANIFESLGYKVIKSNYVGDIGIHICKSMLMYMKYGEDREPNKKSDHFVGDFYVMFEQKVRENPELNDEAQELLRKWEAGDSTVTALWKKMNEWVYKGWEQTYEDENVSFDVWEYESEGVDLGKEIAELAVKKGIAERDESGAIVARLEKYGLPDKVLLRSDGTSIYSTKDLQLAKNSFEKYHFDKRLYVVDNRQSDYFKQVFKILEVLGFEWAKNLFHISYGIVKLPEGNMSSRKGLVINADEVYDKLTKLAEAQVDESYRISKSSSEIAKKVALAALRFGMLRVDSNQDLVFDYDTVTRFEGNTGPYLQYTYARALSLLDKSDFLFSDKDKNVQISSFSEAALTKWDRDVLRIIYKYPEAVAKAGEEFAPHILCTYLFELSQAYNSLYGENPINTEDNENLRGLRLLITKSVSQIIANGLNLLGIEVVESM